MRKAWISHIVFCHFVLLAGSWFLISESVATPEMEDLVMHPRFETGRVSPSGKYLAVTGRNDGVQGLLVINLDTMAVESGTHFGENEDVWDFFWANDERLLLQPALRTPATMSYKAPTGELIGINADGSNLVHLSGFRSPKIRTGSWLNQRRGIRTHGEVFDLYTQDKDQVLVQAQATISNQYSRAYLLNINTGSTRIVGRSKTRFGRFVADNNGLPTINVGENANNETELYYRKSSDAGFELLSRHGFGQGSVEPLAVAPNTGAYYVLENISADTKGVSLWYPDRADSFVSVFRHPSVDVDSIIIGGQPLQLIAAKYYDPLPNYYYFDETLAIVKEHQRLRHRYPDRDVMIESVTEDMSKAVINLSGDIYPSTYYLLDVASGEMEKIFSSRPQLQTEALATMRPVSIRARDGLNLQGYLTLPKNLSESNSAQKLPLVVLVHGGPYGLRDYWGYDFEVQLLASRGYAVLQVNFRGSPGMGLQFQVAGIGEWGAAMQDDITDATHWVIAQGLVDPERICIYGSSYGGYAALMGVVKEPDLYRCAVGYSGIYDLHEITDRGAIQATSAGASYLEQVLGDDIAELEARSPYYHAEKIKARVFLAHGRKDNIAPFPQANNMRAALKAAGNAPDFFVERKEGHGFFGERSRLRYYNKLLAFLEENIGGASTTGDKLSLGSDN